MIYTKEQVEKYKQRYTPPSCESDEVVLRLIETIEFKDQELEEAMEKILMLNQHIGELANQTNHFRKQIDELKLALKFDEQAKAETEHYHQKQLEELKERNMDLRRRVGIKI